MKSKIFKCTSAALLSILTLLLTVFGAADYFTPTRQSYYVGEKPQNTALVSLTPKEESITVSSVSSYIKTQKMTAKLFGVLPIKEVNVDYYDKCTLYVGGFPFGVKFYTEGIMVVELTDVQTDKGKINPAYNAGIRTSDIITKCDGKKLSDAEELTAIIEGSGGKELTLTYMRNGAEYNATIFPVLSAEDRTYKTGMWIRDCGAGIGTVTYINPSDNSFGGLGHGICDSKTGDIIPMEKGTVMNVVLNGINKGIAGEPGELKGCFGGRKLGNVVGNTSCGVFGIYSERPSEATDIYPIGLKSELKDGKATLLCTLDDDGRKEYEIEISSINRNASEDSNKCFTVKVTDLALVGKSGGIIQGMSGSPIIQNGKLVGAITHVMINDPTVGYGIFIENMLSSTPEILK